MLKRTLGVPLFQEQLLRMAMTVANFTGAEADELRRAVGMRRSWERMKNLEGKLRAGMTANGIDTATQDTIVQNISSFALYGFPESHAASFALIAYASAYFKVKYLAAFTCAILNNQPMGFYSPAVLVKDAQRHGLRVKPIDVQVSEWPCTIEHESDGALSAAPRTRLREGPGASTLRKRWSRRVAMTDGLFRSAEDLALRVPALTRQGTDAAGADRRVESARRHPPSPRCALAGGARGQAGGPAAAAAERVAAGCIRRRSPCGR